MLVRPARFRGMEVRPGFPRNFSPAPVFLEATATIIMKTLLSILSILALTVTAISLDAYPLDAGAWLTAAMVAPLSTAC